MTVTNVAPTVTINPIPAINEFGTTTISGVISDPGWLDTLTATIDYDDGAGTHALPGVLENVRPNATLHLLGPEAIWRQWHVRCDGHRLRRRHLDFADRNAASGQCQSDDRVIDLPARKRLRRRVGLRRGRWWGGLTVPAASPTLAATTSPSGWDWDDGTTSTSKTSLVNVRHDPR